MSYMVYVACEMGLIRESEKFRIICCMLGLELPVWHQDCTFDLVQMSLCCRLQHSGGLVRMPLPTGLGKAGNEASIPIQNSLDRFVYNLHCQLCFPLKGLFKLNFIYDTEVMFIANNEGFLMHLLEIFNDINEETLFRAYEKWCNELNSGSPQ